MAPSIKLTYFNFRGLGEMIRLILKYGDVDFEDFRITKEEWTELKPTTPFGQLPLYEEDGKVMWQSMAICRYVAKKVGLAGDTDWERLQVDAIADTISDIRMKIYPIWDEKDEARKEQLKQTFVNETVPFYLKKLDKIAGENDGYSANKKLSWADLYLYNMLLLLITFLGDDYLAKYKNLEQLQENVLKIPNIKSWVDIRPKTEI